MKKQMERCMLLAILLIAACTNPKESGNNNETRVLMRDSIDAQGVQRMQVSKALQTISFKGKEYTFLVQRVPNDSLPRVKNDRGEVFVDNKITLRLTKGGDNIFNQTFTKHHFASIVSGDFLKQAILEGMVFDKTTSQGFVFAVSISYPQTDLYIPISLTISPEGKMTIAKEELLEEIYEEGNQTIYT